MCDVGNFCNSEGLCEAQLPEGSLGCSSDYDCENSAGCQILNYVNITQNKCVKYYSLKNLSPNRGYSDFLCSSRFNNGTHCVVAPVSKKVPTVCTSSEDCISKTGGYEGHCGCGYNSKGLSYCSLFSGDKSFLNAAKLYEKWFNSETLSKAHTSGRYDYDFIRKYWNHDNAAKLVYYDSYSKNFAAYYGTEECVLEVFGRSYLSALNDLPEEEEESSSFGTLAGLMTLAYLF
jgi:hypothetical protein